MMIQVTTTSSPKWAQPDYQFLNPSNQPSAIIARKYIQRYQSLNMYGYPDQWLEVMLFRDWSMLHILELEMCKIRATDLGRLLGVNWGALKFIDLGNNPMGDNGAKMVTKMSLPVLKILALRSTNLGNEGMRHLTKGHWPLLDSLYLGIDENKFGGDALGYLCGCTWKLTFLRLKNAKIKERERRRINRPPQADHGNQGEQKMQEKKQEQEQEIKQEQEQEIKQKQQAMQQRQSQQPKPKQNQAQQSSSEQQQQQRQPSQYEYIGPEQHYPEQLQACPMLILSTMPMVIGNMDTDLRYPYEFQPCFHDWFY